MLQFSIELVVILWLDNIIDKLDVHFSPAVIFEEQWNKLVSQISLGILSF